MEADCAAGRNNKGDKMTEQVGIQKLEQGQTSLASHVTQVGHCVHPISFQQPHTDLDSDVSDDTDQELDIDDQHEGTLNPNSETQCTDIIH